MFFRILITTIAAATICIQVSRAQPGSELMDIDFFGDTLWVKSAKPDTVWGGHSVSTENLLLFFGKLKAWNYHSMTTALLAYKNNRKLDDWLFYQLIRKTAQRISPKQYHYERYTLLKWFLLTRCGYNATLKTGDNRLFFYVQTDEDIFNLPVYYRKGLQYVCLNHHDYGYPDLDNRQYEEIQLEKDGAIRKFSYRVTHIPDNNSGQLQQKEVNFIFKEQENRFTILINPTIQQMFVNYPVVNYEMYFNIPLSRSTYESLIPQLKQRVSGMSQRNGVDFIMRFTRYAFLFESDSTLYGREKRLSPEQTLMYQYSDCEDRAALFFFLIKEIYRLPMIVLCYPKHITVAVKLDKPVGNPIIYNGEEYTIAEPTPQEEDLAIGKILPSLKNTPYEIVFSYRP